MPFLDSAEPMGLTPQLAEPPRINVPTPPIGRLFDAAMRRENLIGSFAESVSQPRMSPFDRDYDPFKNIAGYEDYASSFLGANNDDDVMHVKTRIDAERKRAELLDSGGLLGLLATGAATLIDPTTIIPVGGQIMAVTRTGRALAGAARLGVGAGAGAAAQEAGLQATQLTRPIGESVLNIGGATVLGGALGGAVGAFGRPITQAIADSASRAGEIFDREVAANASAPREPGGSIGAAAVRDTTLEQETIANALGVDRALAFSSPTLRLGTSASVETRRIAQDLAEQPLDLRKNIEGIPTPVAVERLIRQADAPLAEALTGLDDLFVRYRTGRERAPLDVTRLAVGDAFGRSRGALSYDDFAEAVGRAMRREDKSDIPEVAEAAKLMRQKVFDPLKTRAIEAGLLPEDVSVETALSYLTRVYNGPKIAAQRPQFERILTDWLAATKAEVGDRLREMQTKLSSTVSRREAVDLDLFGKRQRLSQVGPEAEGSARQFAKTDRALKLADRQFRRLTKAQQEAQERLAKFTPTPDLERDDPLVRALRDIRRGTNREPERLTAFLRRTGGLRDEAGELRSLDLDKGRRGLVRENGQSLDDAALRAWEEGYFPDHAERPTINDLLDALGEDSRSLPRYSQKDIGAVEYHDYLRSLQSELDQRGIKLDRPDAEIDALLREGDATKFRENTPAARARAREMAFNVRRAEREAAAAAERVKGLQAEWDKVRPLSQDTAAEAAGLRGEVSALEKELAKHGNAEKRLESSIESQRVFAGLEDVDLQDIARQITDTLLHAAPNRSHYLPVPLVRGPLRERTLSIPDDLIEDYLESDIRRVSRIYSRTMASDVTLTERFGRADMEQQLEKVREHYAQLREGVTDERELKRLNDRMNADLRDLAAVRDRIRGTYGLPEDPNGLANRAYHLVRDLNYLRLLGGMTISSFPDLARTVMTHGLLRVAGDGIAPLAKNFQQFKLAANEAKLAGTALDMVLDTRAMAMGDMLDDYGRWSKYERGVQAMTNKFGLVSLMAPWNAAMKQFVGVISQTRSLQAIDNLVAGRAISQAERTRLASLGIGQEEAERIDAMFKAHGSKEDGVWWANTAAWEDTQAADTYRAALAKEIDAAIVTPGQERPLWMTGGRGNIGRMIGQFHSFALSSTQRVLMSALQKRDMATLNGSLLMVGLGMVSYFVKNAMNENAKPLPDAGTASGVAQWVREGVDRSGLTGWLFDAHNIVEKLTRGTVGLSKLTGGEPMSRYASRGALGALLGPTFGLAEDAISAAGAASVGDWTEGNSSAVRRMIPLQNLIGFRHLFDAAEHGVNQALGVPERH